MMNEWISVKESYPEIDRQYNGTIYVFTRDVWATDGEHIFQGYFRRLARIKNDDWIFVADTVNSKGLFGHAELKTITHWMLPIELPKEEK